MAGTACVMLPSHLATVPGDVFTLPRTHLVGRASEVHLTTRPHRGGLRNRRGRKAGPL